MQRHIPKESLSAAVTLLRPAFPDLDETQLVFALQASAKRGTPAALTVADVCTLLRVSKPTALALIHDGRLPSFRVGHAIRIPADALDAFMAGQ
jgi:excisionase family DNA binding protein